MSLLFNTLSKFITASFPKEQVFSNFVAAVTICSDFGVQESKILLFQISHHLFAVKSWHQLPWSLLFKCWDLSQLFLYPLSPFSKVLSSSLSATSMVSCISEVDSSPAVLIAAWDSSSPTFHMMYSAYKLNNQRDNIQSWRTRFPNWSLFFFYVKFFYFFSCIQVSQETSKVVWYSQLFKISFFYFLWSTQSKALA